MGFWLFSSLNDERKTVISRHINNQSDIKSFKNFDQISEEY